MPSELLTVADVAALLGVKPATVRQYAHRDDMPPPDEHIGRTPVWSRATIDGWLAGRPGHGWRKGRRTS